MSIEHERLENPIQWPSGIMVETRTAIERRLPKNSLDVAVALVMIDEVKPLIQREIEVISGLDERVNIFNFPSKDWKAYLRSAYAVLNAESILRTGKPYEEPGRDFEALERDHRSLLRGLFIDEDKQREVRGQRRIVGQIGWFKRELDFVELYKKASSPLDFVDAVIEQEAERLRGQDRKDMNVIQELNEAFSVGEIREEVSEFIENFSNVRTEKRIDAMERGKQRFRELYQDFNH